MIALAAVIATMAGCFSAVPPANPVPVTPGLTRCDPGRLGWAEDGSFWFEIQQPLAGLRL